MSLLIHVLTLLVPFRRSKLPLRHFILPIIKLHLLYLWRVFGFKSNSPLQFAKSSPNWQTIHHLSRTIVLYIALCLWIIAIWIMLLTFLVLFSWRALLFKYLHWIHSLGESMRISSSYGSAHRMILYISWRFQRILMYLLFNHLLDLALLLVYDWKPGLG